jgi:hypothetical protein
MRVLAFQHMPHHHFQRPRQGDLTETEDINRSRCDVVGSDLLASGRGIRWWGRAANDSTMACRKEICRQEQKGCREPNGSKGLVLGRKAGLEGRVL